MPSVEGELLRHLGQRAAVVADGIALSQAPVVRAQRHEVEVLGQHTPGDADGQDGCATHRAPRVHGQGEGSHDQPPTGLDAGGAGKVQGRVSGVTSNVARVCAVTNERNGAWLPPVSRKGCSKGGVWGGSRVDTRRAPMLTWDIVIGRGVDQPGSSLGS